MHTNIPKMKAKSFILAVCLLITANALAQNLAGINTDTASIEFTRFDPAGATQQYIDQLGDEKKERSDAYFEGSYWLMFANIAYEIIVAWIFLSLGLSLWIKKIALKARRKNIQNLIYIIFYFLFTYLLFFPLTLYQGFFREHAMIIEPELWRLVWRGNDQLFIAGGVGKPGHNAALHSHSKNQGKLVEVGDRHWNTLSHIYGIYQPGFH